MTETERKYEADETVLLPDPPGLLGLDAGSGVQRQQLEAVYFDTADLRLFRAGVTLRRRVGGPDEGWHLKLPAGADSRDEHRLPLAGHDRVDPPTDLVSLVRVHSRGAALAPVAQLDTRRRRWVMSDSRGRELVELVEDQVWARTMGSETTTVSWCEVEVELAEHGQVKLLDRIEKQLLNAGLHRSKSTSELGRLLADRLPAETTKKSKAKPGSAGAVVLDYLREQAEQIRAQDPLVRRDAPDAVHQLRVAARRMRSALQAYGKIVDRDATRGLTDELKWVGAQLSTARDSEVIEQRLTEVLAALPEELVMGPVAAQVSRTMQRRRAEGQTAALAALDSDRYLALHDAIDALINDPPLTRRARRRARRKLPRQMGRAWQRLAKRMRTAEALATCSRCCCASPAPPKRIPIGPSCHVGNPVKMTDSTVRALLEDGPRSGEIVELDPGPDGGPLTRSLSHWPARLGGRLGGRSRIRPRGSPGGPRRGAGVITPGHQVIRHRRGGCL